MNISSLSKYALAAVASASILAACSGAQSGMGSTGTMPSSVGGGNLKTVTAIHPMALHQLGLRSGGVVSPDKKKKSSYAYISGIYTDEIYVYDFSKGKFGNSVGTITSGISEPQGICATKSDVWVANTGTSQLLEYAGGSTTSNGSLTDTGEYPVDCAVSKKGDMAASNIISTAGSGGNVVVWAGGKGSPTAASCSNMYEYYFLTYDKSGNIWVDGHNSSGDFAFCEIPSGKTTGNAITLNINPLFPGGVQMHGKYVTILDQEGSVIDEYTVSGSTGTEAATIPLSESGDDLVQDWFSGKDVVAGNLTLGQGDSFTDKGGAPISTASASEALGIAIVK